MDATRDGHIEWNGHKSYYRIFGDSQPHKAPLLVINGGPGAPHNYMLGLAKLSAGRQVVFYDQLGTGLSDRPDQSSLWTIDTYLKELVAVRRELQLNTLHLLGHSWGGMLAVEYLLTKPVGIKSAILASAMISMPLYIEEVDKLKQDLPPSTYQALVKAEADGTTGSPEYAKAYAEYGRRHLYRGDTFPQEYDDPAGSGNESIYRQMWGKSECHADGSLKNWDRINDLLAIRLPTLITSGQYDELTPRQAVLTHDKIKGSELEIFTAGSHCVHVEREAEYNEVVERFLAKHDEQIT